MKKAFEAYYITHYLLEKFQDRGGFNSMLAEEELFYWAYKFVHNKINLLEFSIFIDLDFGLGKRDIKNARKSYQKYQKEME